MTGSEIVTAVCQELDEAVFALRMAVPLTWQGETATAFAAEVEDVAQELLRTSGTLQDGAALLRWHEQHMRTIAAALGWGG